MSAQPAQPAQPQPSRGLSDSDPDFDSNSDSRGQAASSVSLVSLVSPVSLARRVRRAGERRRGLRRRVQRQHERIGELERELVRVGPQVAALEQRVEELRRRCEDRTPAADDEESAQARSLLEQMRVEHARMRERISAATVFEERLRVLEERLLGQEATPEGGRSTSR